MDTEIFGFIAEWFDPQPQLTRQFLLKVFSRTGQYELVDLKSKRCFLKKTKLPDQTTVSHFNVGGKVILNARLFEIVDYADPYTRRTLGPDNDASVVVVSPDGFPHVGEIMVALQEAGLRFEQLQTVQLSEPELEELLPMVGAEMPWDQHVSLWASGPTTAMLVKGRDCAQRTGEMVEGLRKRFAQSEVEQAVWTATGLQQFFFSGNRAFESTATFDKCTCAVVRPHAVKAGHAPTIVDLVVKSPELTITAMQLFQIERAAAAEFLEVYQGVVPEFDSMVLELCTGPLLAMEVVSSAQGRGGADADASPCSALRELAGPWDVEMAKELHPGCIRARFGMDRVRNGLHCTDLPEDGTAESAYFFEIVRGQKR